MRAFMNLERVSEFVEFLSNKDHSIEEVLANLVLRVFEPLEATSIFLFEISPDGIIQSNARYGASDLAMNAYPNTYTLRDATPINECIKSRRSVWVTTLPDWPSEYVLLNKVAYTEPEKSFFCFPIQHDGTPVAVLALFCMPELSPTAEIETFLHALASVFSLHIYKQKPTAENSDYRFRNSRGSHSPGQVKELTERQQLILKMISEGLTNVEISALLGFSESTIRHETIKIYAFLQCNGREEASAIFKEYLAKKAMA